MSSDSNKKANQIQEDREILKQQNQEYADSLAKDIAKKEAREKAKLIETQRNERKTKIAEYRKTIKGMEFDGPLKVLIRFPNGNRQVFGFRDSDKLDRLFEAIFGHSACPDYFFVRSIYPKMEVKCYPSWYQQLVDAENSEPSTDSPSPPLKTFSEHEILNNSVLFVNMIS